MKIKQISIVIPVFNEKESLPELVEQLDDICRKEKFEHEYIFVDDGSTDGTAEVLKAIKKNIKAAFTIISFRKNLGKSTALSVGFTHAKGDIIVTLDADLQDNPHEIPKLVGEIINGYDLVIGWRKERKDSQSKIRSSHLFNSVVTKVGGLNLHDINCGLKAFKREVVEEIDLYGELHRFIPLLAVNKGFTVTEVPVSHSERKYGKSKFGSGRIMHSTFDLVTTIFLNTFKTRPLQMFGLVGLFFILSGMVVLLYLTYLHLLGQGIGRRPLLFLGILLLLFGVQIFSTGLIGELLISVNIGKVRHPIKEIIK